MNDLIVIGAGPAGLWTAITAASQGLKVVVIEGKKDITKITRACSSQFVLDEGYEDETIHIQDNKIIYTKNNFEVPYTGRTLDVIRCNYFSPKGYKAQFARTDKKPIAVKFDKGHLLKDLKEQCESLNILLRFGCMACGGEDKGEHVEVEIQHDGAHEIIEAKKLVIAEGVKAKMAGVFGFNKDRQFFGTPLVVSYYLKNTKGFEKQSWNQYYGNVYHPFAEIMVGTSIESLDEVELTIMGTKDLKADMLFEKLVKDSPLSENLAQAEIVNKTGCSVKSYVPLKTPYKGNVLVIGDSAAHIEVIVQGALMCGYHAGQAVKKELNGENGFQEYSKWWQKAFEFNRMDGHEFVKFYGTLGIKARFTDDEIDYLFSFVDGKNICGMFSQFELPKKLWHAILEYRDQIKEERPDIYEKIQPIEQLKEQGLI